MRIRLGRPKLHPDLGKPEVLAFIAVMLAWTEGTPASIPPKQMTLTVPELMAELADDGVRREVVRRLSVLVKPPNRAQRRADGRRR